MRVNQLVKLNEYKSRLIWFEKLYQKFEFCCCLTGIIHGSVRKRKENTKTKSMVNEMNFKYPKGSYFLTQVVIVHTYIYIYIVFILFPSKNQIIRKNQSMTVVVVIVFGAFLLLMFILWLINFLYHKGKLDAATKAAIVPQYD